MSQGQYYGHRPAQAPYYSQFNGHVPNGSPRTGANPYAGSRRSEPAAPGLTFRKRFERVDWRKLASVNIERISKDLDFAVLQQNIMNVTFCDIEQELDPGMIDPNFIKLFKLAQLTIEYLLHSQDYLANSIRLMEEKLEKAAEEYEKTAQIVEKKEQELKSVKAESKKRKKLLASQQQMLEVGANYSKCQVCGKAFVNATFLQLHIQRRHPEFSLAQAEEAARSRELDNQAKKEIDKLKERLQLTETQLQEEKETLKKFLQEKELEDLKKLKEFEKKESDKWRQDMLDEHKKEVENLREVFMQELKDVHEKYSDSQAVVEQLQQQVATAGDKRSNLGELEDDDIEEEKRSLKKQKVDLEKEKSQLDQERELLARNNQSDSKERDIQWKQKLKESSGKHKAEMGQLREETNRLADLLEQTNNALEAERKGGNKVGEHYDRQIKDLAKKSREQENQIKQQERTIKELKSRPPGTKAQSPPRVQMEPSSEEEEDEEEEEEEEEDEESTEEESEEEEEETDEDEEFKKARREKIKEALKTQLYQQLGQLGVSPHVNGITESALRNKLNLLKKKWQEVALKHKKLYAVRSESVRALEARVRAGVRAADSEMSPGQVRGQARTETATVKRKPVPAARTPSPPTAPSSRPGKQPKQPPPVAPRSPPPFQQPQFSSSEEEMSTDEEEEEEEDSLEVSEDEDDEIEEIPQKKPAVAVKGVQGSKPAAQKPTSAEGTDHEESSNWDSDEEEEEDEEDEDDEDDIDKLLEEEIATSSRPTPAPRPTTTAKEPQGSKVKSLGKSIEMQLSGRGNKRKPTGSIDVGVPSAKSSGTSLKPRGGSQQRNGRSPSPNIPMLGSDGDSDSSFVVSSMEDSGPAKRSSLPRTKISSDAVIDSSNTFGTSKWGSTGKGKSTVNSSVSFVDFDSDSDI